MVLQMFMGGLRKGEVLGRQVAGRHSEFIYLGYPSLLFMHQGLGTMGPGCVTSCSVLPNG